MANQISLEWIEKGVQQIKGDIKEVSSMVEKANKEKIKVEFEDNSLNQYKKDLLSLVSINKNIRDAMKELPKNGSAWKALNSESNKVYKSIANLKKELLNTGDVGAKAVVTLVNAEQELNRKTEQSIRIQKMNQQATEAAEKAQQAYIKQVEKDSKRLNEILLKMQSISRTISDQQYAGKTGKKGKTPLDMSWAIDQYKDLQLEAEKLIKTLGEDSEAALHFRRGIEWTEANNPLRALRDEATKLIPKIASAEAELKKLSIDPKKNANAIKATEEQLKEWRTSYEAAITEFQRQIDRIKKDKSGIFTKDNIQVLQSSKEVLVEQLQTLTQIKVKKQEGKNEDVLEEQREKAYLSLLQQRLELENKITGLSGTSKSRKENKELITSYKQQIALLNQKMQELQAEYNIEDMIPEKIEEATLAHKKELAAIAAKNVENNKSLNLISKTLKNFGTFTLYYAGINALRNGIQKAIDTMIELNTAFTDIQMVTGDTTEATAELAQEYNNLAKELGSTTIEVAEGARRMVTSG